MREPVPKPMSRLKVLRARHQLQQRASAELHRAVMARSRGRCECCARLVGTLALQLDHFLGGSGRRREEQSVENCWALCEGDHYRRTVNLPSTAAWNAAFAEHCRRNGFPILQHVEHDPVRRGA